MGPNPGDSTMSHGSRPVPLPPYGLRVTGWIAEDPSEKDIFVAVECHACRRTHFVNPRTEKTLGDDGPHL